MKIYLIRHGKTEANLQHLYCGSTDLPLSEIGKNELLERKDNVTSLISVYGKNLRFATSGMKRCNETLKILFGEVDFEVIDEFREIDFGVFEMHSYEELKDDPDYQTWLEDQTGQFVIPGGESNLQFVTRVAGRVRELAATHAGNLFVVCHGGTIAGVMSTLFHDKSKSFYDWIPHACEGYVIYYEENRPVSWECI